MLSSPAMSTTLSTHTPAAARAPKLARSIYAITALFAVARVALAVSGAFNLSPDEAYFWEWSRHMAWGFYDQGPMVATLIRLGTMIFGATELGVRAPAILMSAASSLLLARLTLRLGGGPRAALLAVLAFNVTPLGQVNSFIMTYYLPQIFLWTLTCHALLDLADGAGGSGGADARAWLRLGLWLGLGGLTHHTFIWLALLALIWTLWVPRARRGYRSPWPWAAIAIALALVSPYVVWNAAHDWATVRHALGLVATHNEPFKVLRWYVVGQFGVLSPFYFAGALVAIAAVALKAFDGSDPEQAARSRLVALGTWPLFFYVGVLAWSGRAEANWTSSATVLLASAWAIRRERAWERAGRMPWLVPLSLGVALAMTVAAHDISFFWRMGLQPSRPGSDLTHRLHGWREIGVAAFAARESLSTEGPTVTISVDDYAMPASLAFYAPDHQATWCPPLGRRHHQYDFWKQHTPLPGGNGVWVSRHEIPEGSRERELFRSWSPPRRVDIVDRPSGVLRRSFYYYMCRGFTGKVIPAVKGW